MLRQIISKWGIMSIDLQTAIDKDMAVIHEDGSADYVETEKQEDGEIVSDQDMREAGKSEDQESDIESEFFNN